MHTKGPWRWEINRKHKNIHLVGGNPQYDLTIMDFVRWGMSGACPRFIEPNKVKLQILHRICDRPDLIIPFRGRFHHAQWCAGITHPDANLIAASPDLLEACKGVIETYESCGLSKELARAMDIVERAISKAEPTV